MNLYGVMSILDPKRVEENLKKQGECIDRMLEIVGKKPMVAVIDERKEVIELPEDKDLLKRELQ